MKTLDQIISGMAYGFGGICGVATALTAAAILARYIAPLF